jgi:hypothetical protein
MLKAMGLIVILLGASTVWAGAEDRVIVKEKPGITITTPGVEIEKRSDRIERREVETTGRGGCDSKTVRKEGPEGSKTVTKERCD